MASLQELAKMARLRKNDKVGGRGSRKRIREILSILRKYDARHGLTPEKAVHILEDLGPTFVKLGQMASTHPDMLPQEYCDAFAKLQAEVEPMDFETVKEQIEHELGSPAEEIFSELDPIALGSASIAQVHKGTLKCNGKTVAVKVQRPGIVKKVKTDLYLMQQTIAVYEFFDPDKGQISFEQLVDELVRTTNDELDFDIEANNLIKFHENNKDRSDVYSPKCYKDYSTKAILTMDYVEGPRIGDPMVLKDYTHGQRDRLAEIVAQNYIDQIVEDGFFHADPHGGNLIVVDNGDGIEWIDFGMMGTLDSRERDTMKKFMVAVAKQDAYGLKRAILQIVTPKGAIDHSDLLSQCDTLIQQYFSADLDSFSTGSLLQDLMMFFKEDYDFPPCIMMLGRGLVTLEGTVASISPKVSVIKVISKYMRTSMSTEELKLKARAMAGYAADSAESMTMLPTKVMETIDMLQKGQVKASIDLRVDKNTRSAMRLSLDYFTFAVIASSLFIGSCILCLTDLQPQIFGVPLLGMVGFVTGFVIAIIDFYAMRKTHKHSK